jgi:YVTN family beta-propeller protein
MEDRILPPVFTSLGPSDPRVIGGYELRGRLGAGGMGTAYLAEDAGTLLVVKVLRPDLAENPAFRVRLRREIESLRRLSSVIATTVIAEDLDCATPWFSVKYVEGVTLAERVNAVGPMQGQVLESFAMDLARQIQGIHSVGVTHRDIKPSNIVLSPQTETGSGVRIIDFGVALIDERTAMTKSDVMVGTLGWTSPEQVSGDAVGPPADVHAWALCVLYAASGQSPFHAGSAARVVYRVVHSQPEIPFHLPSTLSHQVQAALQKDPAKRPSIDDIIHGHAQPATSVDEAQMHGMTTVAVGQTKRERRLRGLGKVSIAVGFSVLLSVSVAGALLLLASQRDSAAAPEPQIISTAQPQRPAEPTERVVSASPPPAPTPTPTATPASNSDPLAVTATVRETIPVDAGCGIEITGNNSYLLVSSQLGNDVTVIDTATTQVMQRLTVDLSPCWMVRIGKGGEGGNLAYVNGVTNPDGAGTGWNIVEINSQSPSKVSTNLGSDGEYVIAEAVGNQLTSDSWNSITASAYGSPYTLSLGSGFSDAVLSSRGDTLFISSMVYPASISIYDANDGSPAGVIPLESPATNLLLSPDDSTIFATGITPQEVTVIDVATRQIVDSFEVGSGSSALALSPTGDLLYVGDLFESRMRIIDVLSGDVAGEISVPNLIDFTLSLNGDTLYALSEGGVTVIDVERRTDR